MKRIPTVRSSAGISVPSTRQAVDAPSRARARTAAPERRVARASSHLPSSTSAQMTVPVSKYKWPPSTSASSTTADHAHEAIVPRDTRVSMVAPRWRRLRIAARWKAHPEPNTTTAEATRATQRQPSNCNGGTIDTTTTGSPATIAMLRRRCRPAIWRRSDSPSAATSTGAEYPASSTTRRRLSASMLPSWMTVARLAAKFTRASTTPAADPRAACTRDAHEPQVMPSTRISVRAFTGLVRTGSGGIGSVFIDSAPILTGYTHIP